MIKEFGDWLVEKLNPAQPAIWGTESRASPQNIIDYQTAFREIELIHRAVEFIINACAEVPFEVCGEGPVKKINKILNERPNPWEDRNKFFRRAFLDYMLDGNVFFYYDKTSLYILPANSVTIIPDKKTFIAGFEYLVSTVSTDGFNFGRSTATSRDNRKQESIFFEADEIIHIRSDNDQSIYRGESKIRNLERLIQVYYSLISFQKQFFINNAIPGLVLQTDNVLSQKVKQRTLEQWKLSYNTIFLGARSPAILDGGLKIDKFSDINFQQLDFENSVDRIQQDMSKALGVPYILLKSGNNANLSQNQILFYIHTILPILDQFANAFQHFFGDTEIKPDKLSILALRPDAKVQATYWATLVNSGIATINEARVQLRLEERHEAKCDELRDPENITGSAVNPSAGGRPTTGNSTKPKINNNEGDDDA